jgi:hypothetical protein
MEDQCCTIEYKPAQHEQLARPYGSRDHPSSSKRISECTAVARPTEACTGPAPTECLAHIRAGPDRALIRDPTQTEETRDQPLGNAEDAPTVPTTATRQGKRGIGITASSSKSQCAPSSSQSKRPRTEAILQPTDTNRQDQKLQLLANASQDSSDAAAHNCLGCMLQSADEPLLSLTQITIDTRPRGAHLHASSPAHIEDEDENVQCTPQSSRLPPQSVATSSPLCAADGVGTPVEQSQHQLQLEQDLQQGSALPTWQSKSRLPATACDRGQAIAGARDASLHLSQLCPPWPPARPPTRQAPAAATNPFKGDASGPCPDPRRARWNFKQKELRVNGPPPNILLCTVRIECYEVCMQRHADVLCAHPSPKEVITFAVQVHESAAVQMHWLSWT